MPFTVSSSRFRQVTARFLLITTLALLVSCSNKPNPPNILLIMVDDLGFGDLTTPADQPSSITPNIDKLASESVQFTRHYTDTVCVPSRAAMMSGVFPTRLGYKNNPRGISPDRATLPRSLQSLGYHTYHIGKWFGDTTRDAWPDRQGFDGYFGFLNARKLAGTFRGDELIPDNATYFNPWLMSDDNTGARFEGHLTDILVEHTINKLKTVSREQPWFINLWTFAPHFPIQPSQDFAVRYPANDDGKYSALLNQLDHGVGRIIAQLERSGQLENTVIVFLSDNGGTNFSRDNNFPLYGSKRQYLEGSVRTPLYIRWPRTFPMNTEVDQPVSIMDIYPTLLSLAGGAAPGNIDGFDISGSVSGGPLPPRALFLERYYEGRYAYGMLSADGRWRLSSTTPWALDADAQRLKISETHSSNWWEQPLALYDLKEDPNGAVDVSSDYPGKVKALRKQHATWHKAAHRLNLRNEASSSGVGKLSGDDFQRIPGYGGYSFAIGLGGSGDQPAFTDSQTIASQAESWSLLRQKDGKIELDLGSRGVLSGQSRPGNCTSVIFSSYFMHNTFGSRTGVAGRVRLYIDGKMADERRYLLPLDEPADLSQPTLIGGSLTSNRDFAGSLTEPIVLNTPVAESGIITPASLDEELCSGL